MYKLIKQWPKLNIVIAVILIIVMMVFSKKLMFQQRLLFLESIFISLHMFEEYGKPGKMPRILNVERYLSNRPTQYPYNMLSSFILNYVWAIILFGVPIFFPKIYWLVLAPVLFGIIEFFMHLVYYPKGTYLGYSSGLVTTIIGFIPCGILYIAYASVMNMATTMDWLYALFYSIALYFIFFFLGRDLFATRYSKFPFPKQNVNNQW